MKDQHWLSGPDEDEDNIPEQWEIDEALADDQGDDQWLDENEKAYIAGFKAGTTTPEDLSPYDKGFRAGISHNKG